VLVHLRVDEAKRLGLHLRVSNAFTKKFQSVLGKPSVIVGRPATVALNLRVQPGVGRMPLQKPLPPHVGFIVNVVVAKHALAQMRLPLIDGLVASLGENRGEIRKRLVELHFVERQFSRYGLGIGYVPVQMQTREGVQAQVLFSTSLNDIPRLLRKVIAFRFTSSQPGGNHSMTRYSSARIWMTWQLRS